MLVNGRWFDGPDLYTPTGTVNRELSHTSNQGSFILFTHVDSWGNYYLQWACSCLDNRHLLLQVGGGIVTPLHELTQHKAYPIVHIGRSTVGEHYCVILKLWDELNLGVGRNVFIILPVNYASLFTPRLVSNINNGTLILKLVLLGFTPWGLPILQFLPG